MQNDYKNNTVSYLPLFAGCAVADVFFYTLYWVYFTKLGFISDYINDFLTSKFGNMAGYYAYYGYIAFIIYFVALIAYRMYIKFIVRKSGETEHLKFGKIISLAVNNIKSMKIYTVIVYLMLFVVAFRFACKAFYTVLVMAGLAENVVYIFIAMCLFTLLFFTLICNISLPKNSPHRSKANKCAWLSILMLVVFAIVYTFIRY